MVRPSATTKVESVPKPRSPRWEEWLQHYIGRWFLRSVPVVLRREVCDQAKDLIKGNLLEQFRRPTVATRFSELFDECQPNLKEEPIKSYAAWVVTCLLALGRTPRQAYTDVQLGFRNAQKIANA